MELCKDCKHFVEDFIIGWAGPSAINVDHYCVRFPIEIGPVMGDERRKRRRCEEERTDFYGDGVECGRLGRYFEPKINEDK